MQRNPQNGLQLTRKYICIEWCLWERPPAIL